MKDPRVWSCNCGCFDNPLPEQGWDVEDFIAWLEKNQRSGAVGILRDYMKEDEARLRWAKKAKP